MQIVTNQFTTFKWDTPEEEQEAKALTQLNRIYLMSKRGEISQCKLALTLTNINPEEVLSFAQQIAFLDGQRDLLNELLGE